MSWLSAGAQQFLSWRIFFDLSGNVSLGMTSQKPTEQETEPSREQDVSKKQGIDTRESTELMVANAFATLFCCFCLGLSGIVMAYKSRIATKKGRAESAKSYLCTAKFFYWTAVAVGLVIWMVYIKMKDCPFWYGQEQLREQQPENATFPFTTVGNIFNSSISPWKKTWFEWNILDFLTKKFKF